MEWLLGITHDFIDGDAKELRNTTVQNMMRNVFKAYAISFLQRVYGHRLIRRRQQVNNVWSLKDFIELFLSPH